MNHQKAILERMNHAVTHIQETVLAEKAKGRKVIGCTPVFVPEELVYATGALPIGVWGSEDVVYTRSAEYLPAYACSVVQGILELSASHLYDCLDAVLLTGLCDTLKCMSQILQFSAPQLRFVFVRYPQNYRLEGGVQYLSNEFQRVKTQLEEITGTAVTEQMLHDSIELYNADRIELQKFSSLLAQKPGLLSCRDRHAVFKSRLYMDVREHLNLLYVLNETLSAVPAPDFHGIRTYMSGVMTEPVALLDIMDELGFSVVGDELLQESRQFRQLVPQALSQVERLARYIQNIRGEAFLYDPQKERCGIIAEECLQRQAECVIFVQMKFCDTDEYDYPWIRKAAEAAGLSVLNLEIEQNMTSFEGVRTRLQAFAELLQS